MSEYKNVLVYIETTGGKAKNVGLEVIGPAKKIAADLGGKVLAVIIGDGVDDAVGAAASYGAGEIITVGGSDYADYSVEGYVCALETVAKKYSPAVLMMGATSNGRELAPRLAARLKTGAVADCTVIGETDGGTVEFTRPVYSGRMFCVTQCAEARPQIATVRPGIFKRGEPDTSLKAEIIKEDIAVPAGTIRTSIVERIAEAAEGAVKLEDAEVIVSGGRGLGKPENFALVKELADLLGGVVGASRAAVDAGWISHVHQVGQTGKTVGPKLYIACGISGAIQHLAGMSGSDTIIAINRDADAPIFEIADYGIVGDIKVVLPALSEQIRKLKA